MPTKEPASVTSAKIARTGLIIAAIIALVGVLFTAYQEFILKLNRQGQPVETEYIGRVLDANTLHPVAGAKVTLDLEGVPPIVYTDSEGVYRFKVAIASDISGQIKVDAQGYQVYTRNITIRPDLKNIEDIRLSTSGGAAASEPPNGQLAKSLVFDSFNADQGFQSTGPQVNISQGKILWNVSRSGGEQYLYLGIQPFKGNVRLTVLGQINESKSNCACGVGVGDKVGSGIAIKFGYYGGGCSSAPGYVVLASGASFNMQENPQCTFVGDWLSIKPKTSMQVELTMNAPSAELAVDGIGQAKGLAQYLGDYNTLWIGMSGDGDWPSCSGEIDSIKIEPLR